MFTTRIAPNQVSSFYTWTFPGAPVSIHLHFGVVETLGRKVRLAFESGASHGAEIGGLLLGKGDPYGRLVEIRDFEPLVCEGRSDGRFVLSGFERRQLETKLAARRSMNDGELSVVGYYRSHIGQGLSLNEQDLSLAQACFYEPANVFLLIKPSSDGTVSAGFFFRDNGQIHSGSTFLEFPFDADQLATTEPADELSPADFAATTEISEQSISGELPASRIAQQRVHKLRELAGTLLLWVPRQTLTLVRQARTLCRRRSFSTLILSVATAALMIALAALTYSAYRRSAAGSPALGLRVERRANELLVSWSRDTPLVHNAREAVLSIRDGDVQRQNLYLDLEQLRNGSVLYSPASASVQFRLDVTAKDNGKTSETILALAAPKAHLPSPLAPRNQLKPVDPHASRQTLSTQVLPQSPVLPSQIASALPEASDVIQELALSQRDHAFLSAPLPQRIASGGMTNATQPPGTVSSEQGQFAASPTYVAPRPIREPQPKLSPEIRATLTSEAEVQVKVKIDELGRVVRAESVGLRGPASTSLMSTTENAARLWKFAPAMRGNQAVASEAVLKFTYRPEIAANSAKHSH